MTRRLFLGFLVLLAVIVSPKNIHAQVEQGGITGRVFDQAGAVVPGLIAAHALARGTLPVLATIMPNARSDGLATSAGRVEPLVAATAAALALVIALLCLPPGAALMAVAAAALGAAVIAVLAKRQIGGMTGDVLGAAEQVGETAVLLVLAARFV